MTVIGLTGGIAVGKTTISNRLINDGFQIIDADEIVHNLYQSDKTVIQQISNHYPSAYENGQINRKKLAQLVVINPTALSQIESIIHDAVINYISTLLKQLSTAQLIILSAPLLFETGLDCFCDKIICLHASKKTQQHRAMNRPNMTPEKFKILYNNQWNNTQRKKLCTLWVSTETTEQETYKTIIQFLKKYA